MTFLCISFFFRPFVFVIFFRKIYHRTFFKHNYAKMNWFQPMKVKIIISLWIRWENSICIDFVHKITFLSHFRSDEHVWKVVQRRNGMPDFRENGVIWCARLERKKSASSGVKKFCPAEWSRKMSRGGWFNPPPPPPPGRFRVKGLSRNYLRINWNFIIART